MHGEHRDREPIPATVNDVGTAVLKAAFCVHDSLGPGLLESVYEHCLVEELQRAGLATERQIGVPVTYRDVRLDVGFRIDVLVERSVVVEIKAIDALASIHSAQVLTYLRFSDVRLGYLINFNSVRLKDGIRRLVL